MLRELLFKIKGFCKRKKTEKAKIIEHLIQVTNQAISQAKNTEPLLHMTELRMYEKAMELDEKRKQDYIQ